MSALDGAILLSASAQPRVWCLVVIDAGVSQGLTRWEYMCTVLLINFPSKFNYYYGLDYKYSHYTTLDFYNYVDLSNELHTGLLPDLSSLSFQEKSSKKKNLQE